MYKNAFEHIEEFYKINKHEDLFAVLKKIINFNSAYIFFINPEQIRLEYSYNSVLQNSEFEIDREFGKELFQGNMSEKFHDFIRNSGILNYLASPLKLKNTVFGFLLIEGNDFSEDEKVIFNTLATVIANITKDREINKIISMQIKALQQGILESKQSEETKTGFISHVSHEIRTPLNSILGYADLLVKEMGGKLNDTQKGFVKDIQISAIHLLGMINEILDLSKMEAHALKLNPTIFNLKQVINETCNIIMPLALKKEISITIDTPNIDIKADYQKMQQILFNLLSNAIKFTQPAGNITIKCTRTSDYTEISVKDTGCGIAKENHKKIFEKFEQSAQDNTLSTGLGLTITKELVKLHNGTIEVFSEQNKGAEFVVKLPHNYSTDNA